MATKPRSPNYPALSLQKALDFARKLYAVNHLHKASAEVVSKAIGYTGLNGSSLTAIAALKKYGLIEEDNKELRITQDALTVIVEPPSSAERARTIVKLAHKPDLFAELKSTYPGSVPNDEILRAWFLRKGFIQSTVDTPIRAYRDTMELAHAQAELAGISVGQGAGEEDDVNKDVEVAQGAQLVAHAVVRSSVQGTLTDAATVDDVYKLSDGRAFVLRWPATITPEEYEDFEAWITLLQRKLKRQIEQ